MYRFILQSLDMEFVPGLCTVFLLPTAPSGWVKCREPVSLLYVVWLYVIKLKKSSSWVFVLSLVLTLYLMHSKGVISSWLMSPQQYGSIRIRDVFGLIFVQWEEVGTPRPSIYRCLLYRHESVVFSSNSKARQGVHIFPQNELFC